jgi:hypothetical protein
VATSCCGFQQDNTRANEDSKTVTLALALKVGESRDLVLKTRVKSSIHIDGTLSDESNFIVESAGRLTINEVSPDGSAAGEIKHTRIAYIGELRRGKSIEIEVENGEIKRPPPPRSDEAVALVASWLKPLKAKISPIGEIEVDLKHPLMSLLGGYGKSLGPFLPAKPVTIGDSWSVTFDAEKGRLPDSIRIDAKYVLAGLVEREGKRLARITLETAKEYETKGFNVKCEISEESFFSLPHGEYVRSVTTSEFNGSGKDGNSEKKMTGVVTSEFEMRSVK